MGLDVLTPKGQETRIHEDAAVDLWHSRFPKFRYMHTPKDKPAKADAVLVVDNSLHALVEMKCRAMTYETFMGSFKGEWLVTFQKLLDCANAVELLSIPLVGMLYLIPERTLLYKVLWTPEDGPVAQFEVKRTNTQATVNGGSKTRANAYIDMRDAGVITGATDAKAA